MDDENKPAEIAALERRIKELGEQVRELRRLNEDLRAGVATGAQQLEIKAAQLEESQRQLNLLIDSAVDYAIFMLDPSGTIISWNAGARRIKGYEREEIIGTHFSRFYTEADRACGLPAHALEEAAREGQYETEGWRVRKDGSALWANVLVTAIHDDKNALIGFAKITRDLTERHESDQRLRQAQKMEALGQLTAGVAHDFNNLLTIVIGNIETARRRLLERPDPVLERPINTASNAAERGALLVHRLLAFSRIQPLQPIALTVNTLINGMSDMLRRSLGETIQVETVLGAGIWPVFVDAAELESALLNLAINARDAMPDGGRLTVEAANVSLDDRSAQHADIPPGQYVGIFVSDTGTGMPRDVLAKAFDPFFTTKEPGHGTGLGLSQVYGFMRQSGGHVRICSEIGAGTTVKLYLPRRFEAETTQDWSRTPETPRGEGETILVIEDDSDVRTLAVQMLRELGYNVLAAEDAPSGLRLLDAHRDIVALFADVGLPGGIDGRQLAYEAKRRRSGLKVLFTSGYGRSSIVHHGRLGPGVEVVAKPFTYATLGIRMRRLLEQR